MSEKTYTAYSTHVNGQPVLNNTVLVLLDGTAKVVFENGRAEVPESLVQYVARRGDVDVPGYDGSSAPAKAPVPAEVPDVPIADVDEVPDSVKAAQEHLAEEGEEVPAVEKSRIVPEGFENLTADGEPRCLAAKGDGAQCANVATNGSACQIKSHQAQFA